MIDKRPALVRRTPPPPGGGSPAGVSDRHGPVKEEVQSEDRREVEESRSKRRRSGDRRDGGDHKHKDKDKKEKKHKDKKHKKKRKRGGRKHQRLHLLGEDPYRPHHRKLSTAFLESRESL